MHNYPPVMEHLADDAAATKIKMCAGNWTLIR